MKEAKIINLPGLSRSSRVVCGGAVLRSLFPAYVHYPSVVERHAAKMALVIGRLAVVLLMYRPGSSTASRECLVGMYVWGPAGESWARDGLCWGPSDLIPII